MKNKFVFVFEDRDAPLSCPQALVFDNMIDAKDFFLSNQLVLIMMEEPTEYNNVGSRFCVKTQSDIKFYGNAYIGKYI